MFYDNLLKYSREHDFLKSTISAPTIDTNSQWAQECKQEISFFT